RADFVFSSRRRHTRCLSDWSSDVCSSDLNDTAAGLSLSRGFHRQETLSGGSVDRWPGTSDERTWTHTTNDPRARADYLVRRVTRSEERRVGKECSDRTEGDREEGGGTSMK